MGSQCAKTNEEEYGDVLKAKPKPKKQKPIANPNYPEMFSKKEIPPPIKSEYRIQLEDKLMIKFGVKKIPNHVLTSFNADEFYREHLKTCGYGQYRNLLFSHEKKDALGIILKSMKMFIKIETTKDFSQELDFI